MVNNVLCYHFYTNFVSCPWTTKINFVNHFWRKLLHQFFNYSLVKRHLEQNKEIYYCWTGLENFSIYFCVQTYCYCQSFIWPLNCVFKQISDFSNIFWFRKILSLKSFGNSWGNLYTKFVILVIKFHFTRSKLDLH